IFNTTMQFNEIKSWLRIITLIFLLIPLCSMAQSPMVKISDFGRNIGNLNMFVHSGAQKKIQNVPLVVVLHGCSQSAQKVAEQSGWNELADKYGFVVIYPEQKRSN